MSPRVLCRAFVSPPRAEFTLFLCLSVFGIFCSFAASRHCLHGFTFSTEFTRQLILPGHSCPSPCAIPTAFEWLPSSSQVLRPSGLVKGFCQLPAPLCVSTAWPSLILPFLSSIPLVCCSVVPGAASRRFLRCQKFHLLLRLFRTVRFVSVSVAPTCSLLVEARPWPSVPQFQAPPSLQISESPIVRVVCDRPGLFPGECSRCRDWSPGVGLLLRAQYLDSYYVPLPCGVFHPVVLSPPSFTAPYPRSAPSSLIECSVFCRPFFPPSSLVRFGLFPLSIDTTLVSGVSHASFPSFSLSEVLIFHFEAPPPQVPLWLSFTSEARALTPRAGPPSRPHMALIVPLCTYVTLCPKCPLSYLRRYLITDVISCAQT